MGHIYFSLQQFCSGTNFAGFDNMIYGVAFIKGEQERREGANSKGFVFCCLYLSVVVVGGHVFESFDKDSPEHKENRISWIKLDCKMTRMNE